MTIIMMIIIIAAAAAIVVVVVIVMLMMMIIIIILTAITIKMSDHFHHDSNYTVGMEGAVLDFLHSTDSTTQSLQFACSCCNWTLREFHITQFSHLTQRGRSAVHWFLHRVRISPPTVAAGGCYFKIPHCSFLLLSSVYQHQATHVTCKTNWGFPIRMVYLKRDL